MSRPSPPHCSAPNSGCMLSPEHSAHLYRDFFFSLFLPHANVCPVGAAVSVPGAGDWGGWTGTERASLTGTNQCGGSWVMFVNTHWGMILCTLYLLRTLYVCLYWALLLGRPSPLFLPPFLFQGLRWKGCSYVSVRLSLPHHLYTVVPGHNLVVSRNTHPAVV